jgi:hypothetical protein
MYFISPGTYLANMLKIAKFPFSVPHNWDIAFSALDTGVSLVKSTNKRPIKVGPMSVLTVSGICKSNTVLEKQSLSVLMIQREL